MARFVKQKSDIAESLDKLQGLAQNLILTETNRRVQLGREKEARMADAYRYMLEEENTQIDELELALDAIQNNLIDRGLQLESLDEEHRTIDSEVILSAASEGHMEIVQAKLNDAEAYRAQLQEKKRNAEKLSRYIDLFDDRILANMSSIGPQFTQERDIVEASDVGAAAFNFQMQMSETNEELYGEAIEQRLKFLQSETSLRGFQEDYYAKLKKEIEQKELFTTYTGAHTPHMSAIESYEIPRKQIVETLRIRTQDPAMVLGRHFGPMGALQDKIDEETVPNKQETLKIELAEMYKELGGVLYPQLMNAEGDWSTPTKALSAKMAKDLSTSLALLGEGDPTEFVAYLDHVQSYYDEMKKDQTEEGKANSNRIRGEVLALLGIDMEVPVQFGDEVLSQIEIILEHYKELERIELEQSFHGMQISRSIQPNVSFDASYPSDDNDNLNSFMKSRLKQ